MIPRICFLVNDLSEFTFGDLIDYFLPDDFYNIDIKENLPIDPSMYRLIVPWSYRKLIPEASAIGNILIIHSSDLPEGRGWAPLYNTFQNKRSEYNVCGLLADDGIDTGEIVVRMRLPLRSDYTATYLRQLDHQISIIMVKRLIDHFRHRKIQGISQQGKVSFNARRYPEDNEVALGDTIGEIVSHLRGVEARAPAYFNWKGVEYVLSIQPKIKPGFPNSVQLEFPALKIVENWTNWYYPDDCAQ